MDSNNNSGICNSGICNSGSYNSGDANSGYGNSGNRNSGNRNSGSRNSGNYNSGYYNSGDANSGSRNSGNYNSGYYNSGDANSGYGNSASRSAGVFCSVEPTAIFFNKPTSIKLSNFIDSNAWPDFSDMNPCVWVNSSMITAEEKKEHPEHETTGGYIKKLEYKQAWAVFWRKTSEANKEKVLALPNFDAEVFLEITGIDVRKPKEPTITIEGKAFTVSELKKMIEAA